MSNEKKFSDFLLTKDQKVQLAGGANEIEVCYGTDSEEILIDCQKDEPTKTGDWNDEGCC